MKILRMLYNHDLILPHLNDCLIVWGFDSSRIQLLQKYSKFSLMHLKCVNIISWNDFVLYTSDWKLSNSAIMAPSYIAMPK